MLKGLFSHKKTKADVVFAIAGAIVGIWKASDTIKQYRAEQSEKENNQ